MSDTALFLAWVSAVSCGTFSVLLVNWSHELEGEKKKSTTSAYKNTAFSIDSKEE